MFSIAGKDEDDDGSIALRIQLDDDHNCQNPFNWFICNTHNLLEKLFKGINALLEEKCFDENAFMQITNNNEIKFPSCKSALNIETLMNLGDFQFVLSFLAGHITIFNEVISSDNKDDQSQQSILLKKIVEDFHELRRWLESTDMHVFLAAWNLWDKPHHPYIVNFLLRAIDLEAFHMLLTEEFLGTFYMVSFTNLMIIFSVIYILFKTMYVGLIQPERYTNHSLGYLEFLHRLSDEKIHKDPIPPLAEFVDLAREQLHQVSLLYSY
jgi:hypothetical protein